MEEDDSRYAADLQVGDNYAVAAAPGNAEK
jgi:hypothetical protein